MKYTMQAIEKLAFVERGRFSARPRNDTRYYCGKYPFIQTGDISQSNGLVTSFSQTLNESGLKVSKLFPKGSLAITIAANIGDIAKIDFDFACPDSVVVIRPRKGCDGDWLKYCLQECKQGFLSLATQNAQKNINLGIIKPYKVPTPEFSTQRAIAKTVSMWDSAIEKTERLIDLKKLGIRKLLDTLICKPKKNWPSMNFSHICEPISRKNTVGETNVLTSSAERGLISQLEYYNKSVSAEDVSGYYLLNKGEFAYNRSAAKGYPYGAVKRLDRYERGVLSTLYLCFGIKDPTLCDSDFLSFYFESGSLNAQLADVCQEGARSHGLLNITRSDFYTLAIHLPGISEQRKIAKALSTAKEELAILQRKSELFSRQKSFLMSKLLTGEWEAPDIGTEAN